MSEGGGGGTGCGPTKTKTPQHNVGKNLKKSLLCQRKFHKVRMGKVKSNGGSQKNFKKSLLCPKKFKKPLLCQVAPVCSIFAKGTPR